MTCNRDRTANVLTPPNPLRDYLQRVGEFLNRIPRYRCTTRSEVSLVSLIPAESKKLYTHIVFLSMFLHRCRRVIPKAETLIPCFAKSRPLRQLKSSQTRVEDEICN